MTTDSLHEVQEPGVRVTRDVHPPAEAEMVTITKAEHCRLVRQASMFQALRDAGVDNWEGYSEAFRDSHDDEDEAED